MNTWTQPSFDDLSTPLIDVIFCVLDLETTGGSAASCEITEIGAVKYRGGDLIGSFQTLVDPGAAIPPSITVLTGITQAMVIDAPSIDSVLPALLEFIGDAVIVGHNLRFDLSFLDAAASRLGYQHVGNKSVDTAALARRLVRSEVRDLKLKTLAGHFRSPISPIHRALEDAHATAHVLHGLLERAGTLGVTNLDDLLDLPTAKGSPHYDKISLTDQLPRRPGIYVFRDRNGQPIYVGKATNLRARVRQYFYGDRRRTIANMVRELHHIDHQVCDTPLEAEITELRLIHAHRPRYNRRSRPPKTSHFVKLTNERFPRLSVVRALRDDALAYLGPFRSKRSADLVMTAIWDAIPVRRCRTRPGSRRGKCAPAQLGIAHCPCDGSLRPEDYRPVVDLLIEGITRDPTLLLDRLVAKMESLAAEQRFEEASWVRDRHQALARAIRSSFSWRSLQDLGFCELATEDGQRALVDHGRLVSTWNTGGNPPLRPASSPIDGDISCVPPSVEAAEESWILWKWLEASHPRLVEATGALALPRHRVRLLTVGSGR